MSVKDGSMVPRALNHNRLALFICDANAPVLGDEIFPYWVMEDDHVCEMHLNPNH
jgi:hypothetical protein